MRTIAFHAARTVGHISNKQLKVNAFKGYIKYMLTSIVIYYNIAITVEVHMQKLIKVALVLVTLSLTACNGGGGGSGGGAGAPSNSPTNTQQSIQNSDQYSIINMPACTQFAISGNGEVSIPVQAYVANPNTVKETFDLSGNLIFNPKIVSSGETITYQNDQGDVLKFALGSYTGAITLSKNTVDRYKTNGSTTLCVNGLRFNHVKIEGAELVGSIELVCNNGEVISL